uniref:TIGR03435 family protein n=1 Tax=Solibacter usitatus (strain Ellin6076) TaxID=234267 RepID=Q024H0_SOLUE
MTGMTELSILRACAFLFAAAFVQAQDAAPLAFEVASVKPAAAASNTRTVMTTDAGRISYTTVALGALITKAYDLKNYQLTAPDWVWAERYDVVASLPAGASEKQIPLMLRALLAERFQIVMHREQKEIPVYVMTADKKGVSAKPSNRSAGLRITGSSQGRRLTGATGFSELATTLSAILDRPVLDATGVTGTFEIDLEWTPDERESHSIVGMKVAAASGAGAVKEAGDNPAGASLTTVLREQLGLKLDPRKSPVEILVIDRANRVPTEN